MRDCYDELHKFVPIHKNTPNRNHFSFARNRTKGEQSKPNGTIQFIPCTTLVPDDGDTVSNVQNSLLY
jgi:hypothetical protein